MALPYTDLSSRLFDLISRAEPRVRNALYAAILAARDERTLDELAALIEAGDFDGAIERAAQVGAVRLAEAYAAVYTLSAQSTAKALSDALEIAVGFDQVNFRAVDQMQRARLEFIREFTAEQRLATRAALLDGIERGLNPRDQAREFRRSIGLTLRQERAVQNYRRLLEQGSSEALDRQLRDRRFDRTVARAIREGKPLSRAQVDRMVERYSERYVKYRAEVIGRTEALRAVHQGNVEMYQQAIDAGQVRQDQLERTWVSAKDERVRGSHRRLNGLVRGFDDTFPGDEGPIRFPGDPDAPAAETVQCRCALTTVIAGPLD